MTERVCQVLARVFALEAAQIGADFSQLIHAPWDSLAQLRLVVELEREFACRFEPREIGVMTDLQAIVAVLEQKLR
jgi:acyl carrier protein